jgi:hypothetical protein
LKSKDFFCLFLLTAAAFAIQGYHPAAEDAEIYIPQILKILHPNLYPFGSEFFQAHAHRTFFPDLVAASARLTHLPLDYILFVWQLATLFLVLLACWKLAGQLFADPRARWGAVAFTAALLTLPVAGTSLLIFDQYLNPRSIALFASLFSIADALDKKWLRMALWTLFAAAIHPLMAVFGFSLIAVIIVLDYASTRKCETPAIVAQAGIFLAYPSDAYVRALQIRRYFFILRWEWFEWLGIFGPLLLLWWFSRLAKKHGMARLDLVCRSLIAFELVYFVMALVMTIPPQFISLVRIQPMRSLELVYIFLCLIGGGLLGQWVLRDRVWRWLVLFIPLCAGMFYAQQSLFPASPHVELPGRVPQNDWLQAFAWIRQNTPADAIFVTNPRRMRLPGEDHHGFRALTERSVLPDAGKDSGISSMFPDLPIAEHYEVEAKAQQDWDHFTTEDFERLHRDWGVTWAVLDRPEITLTDCPYSNRTLRVCRVN